MNKSGYDTDKHFQGYQLCFAITSDKNVRMAKQVTFFITVVSCKVDSNSICNTSSLF